MNQSALHHDIVLSLAVDDWLICIINDLQLAVAPIDGRDLAGLA
jgi:hypothetical protein